MPKCKDCKNYRPIDDKKGDCFGHVVSADKNSSECPTNSFRHHLAGPENNN